MKIPCVAAAWFIMYCTLFSKCVAFLPSRRRLPLLPGYSPRILVSQPSNVIYTGLHAVSVQEQNNALQNVDSGNIWEQLGLTEGQLALGVKPEEVLKYIGT